MKLETLFDVGDKVRYKGFRDVAPIARIQINASDQAVSVLYEITFPEKNRDRWWYEEKYLEAAV